MPTASASAINSVSLSSSQPRHDIAAPARPASQVIAHAAVPAGCEEMSIPSMTTFTRPRLSQFGRAGTSERRQIVIQRGRRCE